VSVSLPSGYAGPVVISVFNAAGIQVYHRCGNGRETVDWDLRDAHHARICNGIYVMKISTGRDLIRKKIAVFQGEYK
jgi:hypothetical protein